MNKKIQAAFFRAAQNGNLTSLKRWYARGASLDALDYENGDHEGCDEEDEMGYTALHLAAQNGHTACVRWLVKQGADLESQENIWCDTVVASAVFNRQLKTVKLLQNLGANLFCFSYKQNILSRALESTYQEEYYECFDYLLSQGVPLHYSDGEEAIYDSVGGSFFQAMGAEVLMPTMLNQLVKRGFDINHRYKDGTTFFMKASSCDFDNHLPVMETIIELGGDIHATDDLGCNALFYAKDVKTLVWLLDKGVDYTKKNHKNVTPLAFFRRKRKIDCHETLKKYIEAKREYKQLSKKIKSNKLTFEQEFSF